MNNSTRLFVLLGPATLMLALGCAPAYHRYADGHVDCKYCAPPPLPYLHYHDCVCHACAASAYVTAIPPVDSERTTTDAGGE